jgi:hypothetical protein
VWVINSRQPLAESEQAFLHDHMSRFGTARVVFVVNVFLRADTPEAWQEFRATRLGFFRSRISAAFDHTPELVFASARGCAAHPSGYGGPEARALLRALGGPDSRRVATARLERTAMGVRDIADEVDELVRKEQARLDFLREGVARARADRMARERRLRTALRQAVAACFRAHRPEAERCGPDVAAEIESGVLHRDGTYYGHSMNRKLGEVTDRLAAALVDTAGKCAREHGHRPMPESAVKKLKSRLKPDPAVITVPDTTPRMGKGGAGAAIGATVGTLLFPGVGTVVGGLLGGLAGAGSGINDALNQDRAQAKADALAVGRARSAQLMSKQSAAEDLILAACPPVEPEPAEPDENRLAALRLLRDGLHALARDCLAEAGRRMAS